MTPSAGICVAQLDVGPNLRVWAEVHSFKRSQPLDVSPLQKSRGWLSFMSSLWHLGSSSHRWHGRVEGIPMFKLDLVLPLSVRL